MRRAVIVSAVRSPCGKVRGALAPLLVEQIGGAVIRAAIQRAGIEDSEIDEVIYGNARNTDLKGAARIAALAAGLPQTTPALTVERGCGSALNAICIAATMIVAGQGDCYVAGGMESCSHAPFLMEREIKVLAAPPHFTTGRMCPAGSEDLTMGMTAEKVARVYGLSRTDCDAFGLLSQQRAARAMAEGRFREQILPLQVPQGKKKTPIIVDTDETVRESSMETLAKLKPSFCPDGVCTAGNSSPLTDGASAVVVMERSKAEAAGLKVWGELKGFASAGCDPTMMGMGPVYATHTLLRKLGMDISDIDLVEINEAFAAQSIACVREMNLDMERVNVNGGAIALGHPFGATGGILTTKILYEMERRNASLGLVTFCIGGGQGLSAIYERC